MDQTWERSRKKQLGYARRRPEQTPLYRLIYQYRDEFERRWEQLFQEKYGALRHEVLEAFDAYLNCGILAHGCARAQCEKCNHSELIAFSCKRRGLCPSCDTERAHIFAEHLEEHVLVKEAHRHLIFTIPKRLRVYFRFNRGLTKYLYQAVWESWNEYLEEKLPGVAPGMVMALHTAGDLLHFHPHIHGIALDGGIDKTGTFERLPELDTLKLETLFSDKVFRALRRENLITDDVIDNMRSWQHSGFSVFSAEPLMGDDRNARLFLARYLKKCPVALSRMNIVEQGGKTLIEYTRKLDDGEELRKFSPLEFLAELSVHVPNIWEQTTRFFGHYASRTRGKLRVERKKRLRSTPLPLFSPEEFEPKRPVSKQWAIWIKKVYEVDPLKCPKCGEQMKIKAFVHDLHEIERLTKNLGLHSWRAPPPLQALTSEPTLELCFDQLQYLD